MSIVAPVSNEPVVYVLPTAATISRAIDLTHAVGGLVLPPVGMAATAVTFQVAAVPGADPTLALPAANNTAVSLTIAAGAWAALPADLFGFFAAELVIGAGEAANRSLTLALVRRFSPWRPFTLTIPSGAVTSTPFAPQAALAGNIVIPAAFTGGTLNWQVSGDGAAWTTVLAQTVALNGVYPIPAAAVRAPLLRLSAGSSQAADRNVGGWLKLLG